MKRSAVVFFLLMLSLALCVSISNAQPMGPAGDPMQDSRMEYGPQMMQRDHPGGMGHRGMEMEMGMGMMPEELMEARNHVMQLMLKLGLDQKQKEAVHETIDRTVKELIKKRADMLVARIDLEDIIQREPIDMNAAESKLKELEAIKTDMFLTHLKSLEEIKAMLTPEQKEKLKGMMEMHMMVGKEKMDGKKHYHDEHKMTK